MKSLYISIFLIFFSIVIYAQKIPVTKYHKIGLNFKDTISLFSYDFQTGVETYISQVRPRVVLHQALDSIIYDDNIDTVDVLNDLKKLKAPMLFTRPFAQNEDGFIYTFNFKSLFKVDLVKKDWKILGVTNLPNYAVWGYLLFHNHRLLSFTFDQISVIDTKQTINSYRLDTLLKYNYSTGVYCFEYCDTSRIISFDQYEGTKEYDWKSKTFKTISPFNIYGGYKAVRMASISSPYLSCLDLDRNNSTIKTEKDYKINLCQSGTVAICDNDITIKTRPGYADSLHIWLSKGIQDIGNEQLTFLGALPMGVTMKKSGNDFWFYFPKDFVEDSISSLIKKMRYTNSKPSPTAGIREVKMYLYTAKVVSDPAITFINVLGSPKSEEKINSCTGKPLIINTISISNDTTICFTLKNKLGCDSTHCVVATFSAAKKSTENQEICFGNAYVFDGKTYSTDNVFIKKITSSQGCDSLVTYNFKVLSKKENTKSATICSGSTFDFYGKKLTQSGDYQEVLKTKNGCDSLEKLTLTVLSKKENAKSATICSGATYDFYGKKLTQSGDYQEVLKTKNGCDSLEKLTLTIVEKPKLTLPKDLSIAEGQSVTLKAIVKADSLKSIFWSPDVFLNKNNSLEVVSTPTQNVVYQVIIKDKNDCATSDTIRVFLAAGKKIYAPSSFSPNDDGINDLFEIFIKPDEGKILEYEIFDKWGGLLHKSSEPWNGKDSNVGVYVFKVNILWKDGKEKMISGEVMLVR